MDRWQSVRSVVVDALVLVAIIVLGARHVLDSHAIVALLAAFVGGRAAIGGSKAGSGTSSGGGAAGSGGTSEPPPPAPSDGGDALHRGASAGVVESIVRGLSPAAAAD